MAQKTANPTPGTTRAANQCERERRDLVAVASDAAVDLLRAHAAHTFVTKAGKETPRFAESTTDLAVALMRFLFDGSPTHLQKGAPLVPQVRDQVRALFVLACEMHGVTGTYGQRADWYSQVLDSQVRRELNRSKQLVAA